MIVDVGWKSHAIDYSRLTGLCLQRRRDACKKAALLLRELHGVDVRKLCFLPVRIRWIGVHQDKFYIRVIRGQLPDARELEAGGYNHIIVGGDIGHRLYGCGIVTGRFIDRRDAGIRMGIQKCLHTLEIILIKRAVIHTGGTGNDRDFQAVLRVIPGFRCSRFLLLTAAAAGQSHQHTYRQHSQGSFHNNPPFCEAEKYGAGGSTGF